ncbi:MAG: ABC transporter permease [Chloroflexi bacterium]|nr:ABC transporter permease [Chloroflexota bacterium]
MIVRLAARYISRRLLQSVLFVIGVALGVAVVIAIDIANSSASRAFDLSSESVTGRATHQIIGGPGGLPSSLYQQVRVELGIRDSAPVVTEYVRALELGDQPLRLLGVDPFAEPPFRAYLSAVEVEAAQGSSFDALNAFIAEPNTALISRALAERFGVAPGERIQLRAGGRVVAVRVVGLLQPDDEVSAAAIDDLLLMDIASAQEILGTPGSITRIDLILPENYDVAQITALLPAGAQVLTVNASSSTLRQMTAAFELNLQALSLLALVVGLFLIYNTVTFSVVQRRAVIGVLRALGATKEQIFLLILAEALLLGFIGIVLGMGVGIIFGRAAVGLVAQTISDLYFTVNVQRVAVEPFTLLKGAGIGLLAAVIAALVPSIDATRTPPAGTLRRSDVEQGTRRLLPLISLLALALNATGLLLLQIPTQDIVVAFVALFCIVVGGALLTPLALVLLMWAASPLTERVFGLLGRMAPRAVVRSLSRTAVAVAALTIAVSVIVGVSVMIESFRGTVADWLDTTLGADIYIAPPLITANRATVDVDAAIREQIAAVPGVARVSAARTVNVAAPDYPDLPPANLTAVEFDIAGRPRQFAWNNAPDGDYRAALANGGVIVSEPFAFRRGITPQNNQLRLLTDGGAQTFTVFGVFYDYSTDQGTVYMALATYRRYWNDPFITSIAAFVAPEATTEAVLEILRTQTLVGTDLQAQSNRVLRAGVFDVFDRAFSITIALRLLATVVAFIGILSALLALQLENTRQYGVMRAVGMTPRQLWNFTLIQTGLMGTAAGLMALPIGFGLALVLIYVINVRSFGWTMQLQTVPDEFAQAFMVAVVAALAAGLYPAWRLGRLLISRAVRSE